MAKKIRKLPHCRWCNTRRSIYENIKSENFPIFTYSYLNLSQFDAFHELIITDELARCGSAGLVYGVCAGLCIGLPPILHFGSDYLKDKVVSECLNGTKVICLGNHEIKSKEKQFSDFHNSRS